MTAFTDDDVAAGMEAIGDKTPQGESDVRDILAAVAPAIAARAWHEGFLVGWEHHKDGNYGTDWWDDDTPDPYRARAEGVES